jgi:hypothetical protein
MWPKTHTCHHSLNNWMVLQLTSHYSRIETRAQIICGWFWFLPHYSLDLKIVGVKIDSSRNSIQVFFTTNPSLNALIKPYKSNAVLELSETMYK